MNLQDELFKPEIVHFGTGGTISSVRKGDAGIEPEYDAQQLYSLMRRKLPQLGRYGPVLNISLMQIDSTNMTYEDRQKIASSIRGSLSEGYRRFVVTHGTDTMEETAHYLAFTILDPRRRIFLT